MKLGLSTIAGLGANGDSKLAVLSALFATTDRHSVLGTYGFDQVRRHDAQVDRSVPGRCLRQPDVRQDDHAGARALRSMPGRKPAARGQAARSRGHMQNVTSHPPEGLLTAGRGGSLVLIPGPGGSLV